MADRENHLAPAEAVAIVTSVNNGGTMQTTTLGMDVPRKFPESTNSGADGGWIHEAEAIRIAMTGSFFDRLKVGGRAMVELLRDPDKTAQVFIMGIVLNAPLVPRLLMRFAAEPGGNELCAEAPTIDSTTVDFARLRSLPETTLGGAYARYLDSHRLDPDLFQAPPGLPPLVAFIAQRIRQTHDIWHVLTGYAPDVRGELALQGFTFAQLKMPSSFLIAAIGTMVRAPGEAKNVWDGYRRGRDAVFLPVVRFESHWDDELDLLRARLGIAPKRNHALT
jgi:ubiquinone biosynthesis protein COQ4